MQETVLYALLEVDFFEVLNESTINVFLSEWLVNHYFNSANNKELDLNYDLFSRLESEILNDNRKKYQNKIDQLQNKLSNDDFQEEIFIRGGVFKREIPRLYDYKCSISGMRIETVTTVRMVDACHIVPLEISHDDTIGNGICLSPTLHRAFDQGLLTIDNNFQVLISDRLKETESFYSIKQFHRKQILLPKAENIFQRQITLNGTDVRDL